MRSLVIALIASLGIYAQAAELKFVPEMASEDVAPLELINQARSERAIVIANVYSWWNVATQHTEQVFQWAAGGREQLSFIGTDAAGQVNDQILFQIAVSNVCNEALNPKACLVASGKDVFSVATTVATDGTKTVKIYAFENKDLASARAQVARFTGGWPTIFAWRNPASDPLNKGLGYCTLVGKMKFNSYHLLIGKVDGEGTGRVSCSYTNGDPEEFEVDLSLNGGGFGLFSLVPDVDLNVAAVGLAVHRGRTDVFGDYQAVEAGVHMIAGGLRVALGGNFKKLPSAVTLPVIFSYSKGFGIDASVNIEKFSINPTQADARKKLP